ncbi:MAG TPA: GPW/gp25 family protein [Dehalococcoidia bacterium]|nr:GPW/gp25 family protein [Dehalococcoidia bacterium]
MVERGWLFAHPDFDVGGTFPGLTLSAQGGIGMVEGEAAVRQAILLLISTIPGERVMRPEYGCDLHRLLFSLNDDTTAGMAIHYISMALRRWEPRVDIVRLDAMANPVRPDVLDIMLVYRVRTTDSERQLALSMDLSGEDL